MEKSCQLHWKFSGFENQKREDKNGCVKSLGGNPTKRRSNLMNYLFIFSKDIRELSLRVLCRRHTIMLQLGCYQMNIKNHLNARSATWNDSESLLILLTPLQFADEYDTSNAFIFFFILTALSGNWQAGVNSEVFAKPSKNLSNGCRTGNFCHCHRWELGYQLLYLVFLQIFRVTLAWSHWCVLSNVLWVRISSFVSEHPLQEDTSFQERHQTPRVLEL